MLVMENPNPKTISGVIAKLHSRTNNTLQFFFFKRPNSPDSPPIMPGTITLPYLRGG